MRHVSLQQLSARVDDALSGVSLEIVDRHLAGCEECRGRVSRIQRLDGLLVQLVRREPGEPWLARLEEEIAARLGEETGLRFRFPPMSADPALPGAPRPDYVRRPPAPLAPLAPSREVSSIPPRAPHPGPASPGAPPPDPASPVAARVAAPAAARSAEPPRWAVHADRQARARRSGADRPREAMLPLVAGLLGGAAAGALIVSLVFGTRPQSTVRRAGVAPATHSPAVPASPGRGTEEPTGFSEPQVPAPGHPAQPGPSPMETVATPRPIEPNVQTPVRPLSATRPAPRAARPAAPPSAPKPATGAAADTEAPGGDGEWPMLCGLVVDDTGSPISGARVLLADLELGVRTDRRGRFCISGPAGIRTMSVVALGFATHRQLVTIAEPAADLRIVLGPGR